MGGGHWVLEAGESVIAQGTLTHCRSVMDKCKALKLRPAD